MSIAGEDVFGLVYTTVDKEFIMKEICISLINVDCTFSESLDVELQTKLEAFQLTNKVLCLIKDGGANQATCTRVLLPMI